MMHKRPKRPVTPRQAIDCLIRKGWDPGIVFFEGSRMCRRLDAQLIRDVVAELRKVRSPPRDVRALTEAVDPHDRDDELMRNWQTAIDGLRVLFHASPIGTPRERRLGEAYLEHCVERLRVS